MVSESSQAELPRSARRTGDVRRAECAEALADAFAKGELSHEELNARTELCLAAVTELDLERLVADLSASPRVETPVALTGPEDTRRRPLSPLRVVGFEAILVLVAYVLGVDLESKVRTWYAIAFDVWVVGNVFGLAGAFLVRPRSAARGNPRR